jgi:hypothetical protein
MMMMMIYIYVGVFTIAPTVVVDLFAVNESDCYELVTGRSHRRLFGNPLRCY